MRKLIAGNWKMNGLQGAIGELEKIIDGVGAGQDVADCLICPPFTCLAQFAACADGSPLHIGAQTCHALAAGAHTGDISAEMIADTGATYVILGHSERRSDHGETDTDVIAKVEAALRAGLTPVICIGEHLVERDAGRTMEVVLGQLTASLPNSLQTHAFVIAYEPVWAIGTGLAPSTEQIAEVHLAIRTALTARFGAHGDTIPILYGGSMKPGNAADILAFDHVDGGLIGGASLKAEDFLAIYRAAL